MSALTDTSVYAALAFNYAEYLTPTDNFSYSAMEGILEQYHPEILSFLTIGQLRASASYELSSYTRLYEKLSNTLQEHREQSLLSQDQKTLMVAAEQFLTQSAHPDLYRQKLLIIEKSISGDCAEFFLWIKRTCSENQPTTPPVLSKKNSDILYAALRIFSSGLSEKITDLLIKIEELSTIPKEEFQESEHQNNDEHSDALNSLLASIDSDVTHDKGS